MRIGNPTLEPEPKIGNFSVSLPAGLGWSISLIEHAFGLHEAREYLRLLADKRGKEFIDALLSRLDIAAALTASYPGVIQKTGRLVIVANHPCGALDGLLGLSIMLSVRPDVRLVVNKFVQHVPNLSDVVIAVDPPSQRSRSSVGVRAIMEHLEAEKAVFIFPAGWVASHRRNGIAEDDTWRPVLGRIISKCKTPIVPMFVDSRNSPLFYVVRLLNRDLGSKLLLRELFNKAGARVPVSVGDPIPFHDLCMLPDAEAIMKFLRRKTYELAGRLSALSSRAE